MPDRDGEGETGSFPWLGNDPDASPMHLHDAAAHRKAHAEPCGAIGGLRQADPIQKDPLLPLKQSFFDDYGTKVRELVYKDPKVFGGKLLPSAMEMIPLNKPGHITKLFYNQLEFDPEGVSEKSFSLRELKKRI